MAAQFDEAVVDANLVDAEQRLPYPGDALLELVLRLDVGRCEVGSGVVSGWMNSGAGGGPSSAGCPGLRLRLQVGEVLGDDYDLRRLAHGHDATKDLRALAGQDVFSETVALEGVVDDGLLRLHYAGCGGRCLRGVLEGFSANAA